MKKTVSTVAAAMLLGFIGCSNLNNLSRTDDVQNSDNRTPREEAEQYVSNMYIWDNIAMGRSVSEQREWPDFLSEVSIVDGNNNPVFFDDFSDSEKKAFAQFWYETEVNELLELCETDSDVLAHIREENTILEQARKHSARAVGTAQQNGAFLTE